MKEEEKCRRAEAVELEVEELPLSGTVVDVEVDSMLAVIIL